MNTTLVNDKPYTESDLEDIITERDRLQSDNEALKHERAMLVEALKPIVSVYLTESETEKDTEVRTVMKITEIQKAIAALSITEPQATQWLEDRIAEALENMVVGMNDNELLSAFFVRRLAASKRKEQVSPESDIDQLTRTI